MVMRIPDCHDEGFRLYKEVKIKNCKKLIVRPFSIQPRLGSAWGVSDASAGPRLWLGGGGGLSCCPASVGVPRAGAGPHPHT